MKHIFLVCLSVIVLYANAQENPSINWPGNYKIKYEGIDYTVNVDKSSFYPFFRGYVPPTEFNKSTPKFVKSK